jgi:hypothetical protein
MKEYLLKKYKKYNKFSVFGAGGDEQKKYYKRLQANAERIGSLFQRLNPPFASDLKLSTADLTTCDLISEGPIEGFVNSKGESCSALEATYLDGTVVAEPQLTKQTVDPLTFNKINAVTYDFSSYASGKLNSYARDLETRFVHKQYPPEPDWLNAIATSLNGSSFRGGIIVLKQDIDNIINNTFWYGWDIHMTWNPGFRYDSAGNLTTRSTSLDPADNRMSYRKNGYGYRKVPYSYRKIYHPNQVNYTQNFNSPPNPYQFQTNHPVIYQGSYDFGASINSSGRLEQSFCARAFSRTLTHHTHNGYFDYSHNYSWHLTAMRFSSAYSSYFPNGRPSKYRYVFADDFEPTGLKEPVIDSVAEKINDLGLDYWKPYRFYNSDPSIITNKVAGTLKNTTYSYPSGLYNLFTIANTKSEKVTILGKHTDKFTMTGNNVNAYFQENTNYEEGRLFKPYKTYRFTGSIYMPSTNNTVNSVRIQLIDGSTKTPLRITGGTTEFPFNQWNDFDFEYTIPDSSARRLRWRFYESNNATPGANASGDFFALSDFTVLEKTTGRDVTANTGNFAYMNFSADDFFGGDSFAKDYELTYSVDGDRLEIGDKNGLGFSFPELTGFDLKSKSIRESMYYEYQIQSQSTRNDHRYPILTGASNSQNIGVELTESTPNKFKGAFLYPVYLGERFIPLESDGTIDTNKIFIYSTDSSTLSGNKLQSGISGDYDVFAVKNGKIQYAHVANPNIKVPDVEVIGKDIQLKVQEKSPTLFNFSNFEIDFNLGEEDQKPIKSDNVVSVEFNKSIYGPNNSNKNFDSSLSLDPADNNNQYSDYGMRQFSAIDGTDSSDVESDGTFQSDWMATEPLDTDSTDVVHLVTRKEVDCVKITFIIESLHQEIIAEQDPLGVSIKRDAIQINFSVFTSFEGVPDDVYAPIEKKISYYGTVMDFYAVDTDEIELPSYDEILEFYPNETKSSLSERFPKKVLIRKNDFETTSVRLGRSARVFQVLEIIKEKFSYPFSSVIKTKIDARTFNDPPNKQYQLRLRKIQIPSNYFPLDLAGRDKRFVEDASTLGTKIIYEGDWDGTFKIGWTDNPAWILYDVLTNTRYGLGNRIDNLEDINIFNLYKIGRYCDAVDSNGHFVGVSNGIGGLEPRFSCNIMLDISNNAFEAIKDISSVFNGMAFWANGSLDFFADQPKDPTMFFNNGNVFDGIFNYQTTNKSSLFNIADVTYQDKRDDFTAKTETFIDEDGMRENGALRRQVNARGATSRSQAARLGRYIIYSNKLEREIVNFKAPSQALMLSIGDIIEIQDELKNFEVNYAKVLEKNYGDKSIIIENKPSTNSIINNHSGAFVMAPTGRDKLSELYDHVISGGFIGNQELDRLDTTQAAKLKITGVTDLTTKIKIAVEDTDGYFDLIPTGTLINLDLQNRTPKQYRVLTIKPEESNLYAISATEYRREKFDLIENSVDFTLDDPEPFSIGILENEIKTLTEPEGFSSQVVNNNYGQQIDFEISGNLTGSETAYQVSVIQPNGNVESKRIAKQSTTQNGYFKTTGTFKDIISFGLYTFEVKSID